MILEQSWILETIGVAGAASLITTDDGTRIIVGTSDGCVVALNGDSTELWRTQVGDAVSTWPSIDEVPGLGLCILAATDQGDVLCLSPAGELRWSTHLEETFSSFNNVSVIRGSDDVAVIVSGRRGGVIGMSAAGEVIWDFQTHPDQVWRNRGAGPTAIGDIDSDGRDELLFSGADGYAYCLDSSGAYRWSIYVGNNSQFSSPVITDLGYGSCILIGGSDDQLHCITPDGEVLWEQQGAGAGLIEVGISVGDIDDDGTDEIVFVHQGRAIQAIDNNGGVIWSTLEYVGGDQPFGPSLADLTGDGSMEIIHPQRDGGPFRVIKSDGSLLEEHELSGGMSGAPVVGDVDDDGLLEVLAVAKHDGSLVRYNTKAPAGPGSVEWPTSRGDFTGRANRLTTIAHPTVRPDWSIGSATVQRVAQEPFHLGLNTMYYECDSSAKPVFEITLTRPDGRISRVVTDDKWRNSIDLEILDLGDHKLRSICFDSDTGEPVGEVVERVAIDLFVDELARIEELLLEIADLEESAGDLRREILSIHRGLRMRQIGIKEQFAEYGALSNDERRLLIREMEMFGPAVRRQLVTQRARISQTELLDKPVQFLPWQLDHPWTAFDPDADAPSDSLAQNVKVRTDGRGHEVFVIQVANVHAKPLDVRVWLDPMVGENGEVFDVADHLELRQVTWIPTPAGTGHGSYKESGMNADALPELGNAGIVRLTASSSARLWIDVLTKDLEAGSYGTTLHMRALTEIGATWDVPVEWTVEPLSLPEKMPLKFCNWASGYTRHFAHAADAALKDMQNHHTSVFYAPPTTGVTYDDIGDLVKDTGWEAQDEFLAKMRSQDVLLYTSLPISPAEGAPGEWSEAWMKAFSTFLPTWVEHLKQKGFGYDRWAFYPVDEPGLMGGILIEKLERIARYVKGLDSNVRFYTDPFRGMTVADHKRMVDVLDIVQPAQYGVVLSDNSDRIDYLRTTDQTHWIYEARAGVKQFVEPTYYWEQIWTAWEIGFTGIGYWTYCTTGFDLWEAAADYVLVYQGAKGPVPSKRWQAVRIGIEDYARMHRLRDAIETARQTGAGDLADKAEARLSEVVSEAKAAQWEPGLVAQIRNEVIDVTLELLG